MLLVDRHRRCKRIEWEGVVFTLHPADCTGVGASMVSTSTEISMERMEQFRRAHAYLPFFAQTRDQFGTAHFLPDAPAIGATVLPI